MRAAASPRPPSRPSVAAGSAGTALWLRLLRDHVRGYAGWLAFAVACMALVAGATALQAWLMEPVLDKVFLERDATMLVLVPLAVVAITVAKALADYGHAVTMARVGQRVIADLQHRLYGHLMHADLNTFVERGPGGLISHLTYDATLLRNSVSSGLAGMVKDGLTVVFLVALMFRQDWRLASIAFVAFPLAVLPIARIGRRVRKASRQGQVQMGRLTGRLQDTFQGVRQVKAYGREDDEAAHTGSLIETMFGLSMKAARAKAAASPIAEALGGLAIAAVIWYGGWRVLQGATTPGTFFSFITALLLAYQPVKNLAKLNTQLQQGLAAAQRLYALLDQEPRIQDRPGAVDLRVARGEIRFEAVTFAYRPDRPALNGLDLVVPAGSTVALVGPSGGGKSTMLNLLLRFYDVDGGRVLIDGQDVRDVRLASLRGAIALVTQEVTLFDDTVRANIAYGRPDADEAAIRAAAEAAGADGFIRELPEGYETRVGPSGVAFSGGQRQRLSIARAMLKDAPILLLDEATSALDAETERQVQAALSRLMRGRTTLVIAHRLATIAGADLIGVVEGGRIVEFGTQGELLARAGAYARLHATQFATAPDHDDHHPAAAAAVSEPLPSRRVWAG